jgi:hypothetical protein
MVIEKPVIEKTELMKALDPIHGRGKAQFQALRQAGVLTPGVAPGHGSSDRGVPLLFCSLNRDAISASRRGLGDVAKEFGKHARRIEEEQIAPWLTNAFEAYDASSASSEGDERRIGQRWLKHVLFQLTADSEEIAEPVARAAASIAEVRDRFAPEDPYVRFVTGRIWRMDDAFSEIRPEGQNLESIVVSTEEIYALGLRLGDPVVVRHEELQSGIYLTTVERGLEPSRRVSPISEQPVPEHLDQLLDSAELGARTRIARPLRQLA